MFKTTAKLFFFSLVFCSQMFSMVGDNRYFPFFPRPHTRITEKPSWFAVDTFFTRATKAYDDKENEVEIPALFGEYNQYNLGRALTLIGEENPLPSSFWNEEKLFWDICQKIESQGIALNYEQKLFSPLSVGFSWLLMHVRSCHEFCLKPRKIALRNAGHLDELKESRRKMHEALGITDAQFSSTDMGDFDFYLRVGSMWDYIYKCRRVDAGIKLGVLMPAGRCMDINVPTSVPFGGNGHWGMYVQGDVEFELREDMKFGMSLRGSKRFAKAVCKRLPLAGEHPLYGALVAPIYVDPGMSCIFSPYFSMENIREGLGFRVGLNLTTRADDLCLDGRSDSEQQEKYSDIIKAAQKTGWASDYISINVFYDFGKTEKERGYKPILTFSWDFPRFIFVSEDVLRTHRISLGLEVNF